MKCTPSPENSPGLLWLLSSLAVCAVARACDALRAFTLSVPVVADPSYPNDFTAPVEDRRLAFRKAARRPHQHPRAGLFVGATMGRGVILFGWFCQGARSKDVCYALAKANEGFRVLARRNL